MNVGAAPRTPAVQFDLTRHVPELTWKTAVRLHPRRGPEPAADESKLAGAIVWPDDEPWPACEIHPAPLLPILQIRQSDVPELGFPADRDLFQLLWCPCDHEHIGYAPLPQIRWRSCGPHLKRRPVPVERSDWAEASYDPKPCRIFPERVRELPSAFELETEIEELDDIIRENAGDDLRRLKIPEDDPLYQYHFSTAPGTKVGGYPRWIQDPEIPRCVCGRAMEHLLTIASAEFDGAYQRWMPLEERRVWDEGFEARQAVQCAPGIMIGDMGSLFVFTCRVCLATGAVAQCS